MKELDITFIDSVLGMYEILQDNGVVLVYLGKVDYNVTQMFSVITENETDMNNESKDLKRRLNHAVIEVLQNLTKHSSELYKELKFGKGMFMLGKKEDKYIVYTANKVLKEEVIKLTAAIDEVNSHDYNDLRRIYKEQLKQGKLSDKGGAGLGLIDIARKSGNKLDYTIKPFNDVVDYFIFKVEVSVELQS